MCSYWIINFSFGFLTQLAIKFHTNPFILTVKWSLREPGWPVQKTHPRLKPRLHERFFACDGDAIFLKLSRRQRAAKITRVATL